MIDTKDGCSLMQVRVAGKIEWRECYFDEARNRAMPDMAEGERCLWLGGGSIPTIEAAP